MLEWVNTQSVDIAVRIFEQANRGPTAHTTIYCHRPPRGLIRGISLGVSTTSTLEKCLGPYIKGLGVWRKKYQRELVIKNMWSVIPSKSFILNCGNLCFLDAH